MYTSDPPKKEFHSSAELMRAVSWISRVLRHCDRWKNATPLCVDSSLTSRPVAKHSAKKSATCNVNLMQRKTTPNNGIANSRVSSKNMDVRRNKQQTNDAASRTRSTPPTPNWAVFAWNSVQPTDESTASRNIWRGRSRPDVRPNWSSAASCQSFVGRLAASGQRKKETGAGVRRGDPCHRWKVVHLVACLTAAWFIGIINERPKSERRAFAEIQLLGYREFWPWFGFFLIFSDLFCINCKKETSPSLVNDKVACDDWTSNITIR